MGRRVSFEGELYCEPIPSVTLDNSQCAAQDGVDMQQCIGTSGGKFVCLDPERDPVDLYENELQVPELKSSEDPYVTFDGEPHCRPVDDGDGSYTI